MEIVAGLDFGTTNSALAVLQHGKSCSINICNFGSDERTLRSALFIDEDHEIFVGQEAIQEYIDASGHHGRFMQSLKAFLPSQNFSEVHVYGRRYTIEELVALIMKSAKQIGENAVGLPLDNVILGRPVFFSEKDECDKLAQGRLESAAKLAGFKSIAFELEPVAATLAYLEKLTPGTEQTILMGDFGGGTSDFTIMNLQAGVDLTTDQKRERVLSVDGVYVGGDTFDGRLMWEKITPYFGRYLKYKSMTGQVLDMPSNIVGTLCDWHKIPFMRTRQMQRNLRDIRHTADDPKQIENLEHLIWDNKGFAIFQAIEQAKKNLSINNQSYINYTDNQLQVCELVLQSDFESAIAKNVQSIRECVDRCLKKANVLEHRIDKVLLTGGSSHIPIIRKIFESKFGKQKVEIIDAFTSVAQGLALCAK